MCPHCVDGVLDVFGLTRLVDRQRLDQLLGVAIHITLDTFSLVIKLLLHRLEVLQQVRLGLLPLPDHTHTVFTPRET